MKGYIVFTSRAPNGLLLINEHDGRDVLIQGDDDMKALAEGLGWQPALGWHDFLQILENITIADAYDDYFAQEERDEDLIALEEMARALSVVTAGVTFGIRQGSEQQDGMRLYALVEEHGLGYRYSDLADGYLTASDLGFNIGQLVMQKVREGANPG